MKKFPKKIIILLAILILSGILVYTNYDKIFGPKEDNSDVKFGNLEAVVEKKTFDSEIELTGTTKIKNEQKIKFNTSGKITEVNFKAGDEVKKGDRLVAIEATKAQSEIEKAVLDLDKAERNLEKVVSELKDSKLKNASLDLKSAALSIEKKEIDISFMKQKVAQDLKSKENELEIARNQYIIDDAKLRKDLAISKFDSKNNGNSLTEKNLSYEKQKRDYEEAKANFDIKVEKKVNEYKQKVENAYFDLEKDVRDFKEFLRDMGHVLGQNGYSYQYEVYFSVKNSSNISKIKEYYFKANEDFKKFEESYKKISSKNDAKNILETLKVAKPFYENSYLAFTYLEQGFKDSVEVKNSSESGNTIFEFNPSSESAKFSGASSKAGSMRSSITNLIDELKNFESEEKVKKDLQDELEKQKIAIENMEMEISKFQNETDFSNSTLTASQKNILINLEELKTSLDRKILEFEKYKKSLNDEYDQAVLALEKEKLAYTASQKEFEKLKNISKNEEFLAAEDAVKQAKLSVENATKQLENYVITAPFDGVITKVDYLVGDRITENSEQSVSIVDPKTIEILVSINQSDIIKVRKDMEASIILDSYPEKTLTGKLSEIDTTPSMDNETGLSKFSAKVLIGEYGDLKLYTGMQANVKLKVSSIPESLVVPFSAVNSADDGTKYVTVMENGKKIQKTVEVGEPVGEYYQILSGLKEGEIVLEIDYDASKIKDENPDSGMGMPPM